MASARSAGIETGREHLEFCNSYTRLPTLLALWNGLHVEWSEWLTLLGQEWEGCDNIGEYSEDFWETPLADALEGDEEAKRLLMTETELAAYAALPDEVIVYRGCYAGNKWGLSWSLDRDVAARFPTLNRYRQDGGPLLVKARAKKFEIAAVKLDREELEVITYRPRHISTSKIR